ncbi:MAG: hypothetical protein JXK93_10810 [Sphaerochaetaceae bacterium]|nr:hypothetical protein [Sphaerochaetaceae bacterium]
MKHLFISFLCILVLLTFGDGLSAASGVRKIETEHTTIIYEERNIDSALIVASFADETYEQLAEVLGYTHMKRVPVILFSGSSIANGMYSSIPSRITMYITSDPELFLTSRSSWLYSLYVHELTHFLHLTQQVGPASFLTPVFGPEVPMMNTPLMPGWWIEGITTYTETAYAPGGRGTSSRFLMPVREDPSILPLSKTSYASNAPPRGRIYLGGNILVSYLIETYGEDIYHEINSTFAWFPFFGMGYPVRKVTGESLAEIYEQALRRIGAPAVQSSEIPITMQEGMHEIIGLYEGTLYLQRWDRSKALSLLAYREGTLLTVEERINGIGEDVMNLSPDGSSAYILFRSYDPYSMTPIIPGSVSHTDLYRYDMQGGQYTAVSTGSVLRQVTVSPDTGHIAAVEAVADRYRLVRFSPSEYHRQVLFDVPGSSFLSPAYAPKGHVVAGVILSKGTSSLALLDGSETRVLIGPSSYEIRNVRFVNEHTISFTSDRDAPFSLYTYDLRNGLIRRILSDPVGILDALIDGDNIYYQRYKSGYTGIFQTARNTAIEEVVSFPVTTASLPYRADNQVNYEERAFHDMLRFNLWFPYPIIEDGVYGAGAYSLFTSLLQRHTLLVIAGYTFENQSVRAFGEYRYSPGRFNLSLQADIESTDVEGGVSGRLSVPLFYLQQPTGQHLVYAQGSARYLFSSQDDAVLASAGLAYGFDSPAASKDVFGRYSLDTSYSMNIFDGSVFLSYGTLQASTPSVVRHHSISHRLRAISAHGKLFSDFTDPQSLLPPESFSVPAQDGYARLDYTLSYRIPYAVADIPFLWGGFTSAYLTFASRVAGVYDGASFSFEEDVILSAQAGATYSLGIGFTLNPYVGLEWAPVSGAWGVTVAVGTDAFLSTLPGAGSPMNRLDLFDTLEMDHLRR